MDVASIESYVQWYRQACRIPGIRAALDQLPELPFAMWLRSPSEIEPADVLQAIGFIRTRDLVYGMRTLCTLLYSADAPFHLAQRPHGGGPLTMRQIESEEMITCASCVRFGRLSPGVARPPFSRNFLLDRNTHNKSNKERCPFEASLAVAPQGGSESWCCDSAGCSLAGRAPTTTNVVG